MNIIITEDFEKFSFSFRREINTGCSDKLIEIAQEFKSIISSWIELDQNDVIVEGFYNKKLFYDHGLLLPEFIEEEDIVNLDEVEKTVLSVRTLGYLKINLRYKQFNFFAETYTDEIMPFTYEDVRLLNDEFAIIRCPVNGASAGIRIYINFFIENGVEAAFDVHHSVWDIDVCRENISRSFRELEEAGWAVESPFERIE